MPKPVSEQVVVIAGASSGIGRAAALEFAGRGAKVVCAARGEQALGTLVDQIRSAGGTAVAVPTDVTDAAAVRALAETAERAFGRVDTWVNNAAVGVWGRIEEITPDEFERVMRVNLLGQVHGIQAALPALRRAGGGVLIGVASVEGIRAVPLHSPYTTSKFAVRGLYDCLRMELAQEGAPIVVTTILPSSTATPFFEHSRTKLGGMAKPPPPVYAPQVVARAIVYAAGHPRREIAVGGTAGAAYLGQRFFPALTDVIFSIRRIGADMLHADRPDNGIDNLDGPIDGPGRVTGEYAGRMLRHSAYTWLIGRRRRPGELALSGLRRLHGLARQRQKAVSAGRPLTPPAVTRGG
ncbi:SDR family oxidoreductase [Actinoplanes sp. NPDC024001]|uniref:SDR family oxidoreductase n=1 Tax=Actinoplanes sp. NPDC024001 TaxID=3154598 RepID=UPI0033ED1D13